MENTNVMRRYTKLGFSHLDTAEIVTTLNNLLANYQVHYQKLRNFHWNVTGSDFFELHEKFEEIYTRASENVDVIAERIRVFEKTPLSQMKEYLSVSEIEEPPYGLGSYEMVKHILADFEILLQKQNDVMDAALKIGDSGTIDLINSHIEHMEKDFWMLGAWSKG